MTTARQGKPGDGRLGAFLEAMRWLVFEDIRRPGMLGRCVGFLGKTRSGHPDRLSRVRGKWRLQSTGKLIDDEAVVRKLASTTFRVRKTVIVPEAAPLLFQGAVEQAEASLRELISAERELAALRDDESVDEESVDEESAVAFEFIMTSIAWDKALRHAASGVMLALAAAEAQVNEWASTRRGWKKLPNGKSEDRLPLLTKMDVLARRHQSRIHSTRAPYFELRRAVTLRNTLVHSKPIEQEIPLRGRRVPEPGHWLSVEARKSCLAVRLSFVDLASVLGEEPPRYLAYAPEGRPDDDAVWVSAVIRTGVREDSVFPPLVARE